jgi:hypothetical protein
MAFEYSVVDMSNVTIANTGKRTFVPTLGLSMFAASRADSTPPFLAQYLEPGLVRGKMSVVQAVIQALIICGGSEKDVNAELMRYIVANNPALATVLLVPNMTFNPIVLGLEAILAGVLKHVQVTEGGIAKSFFSLTPQEIAGHDPKPITMVAAGIVPSELPLQLMRIGALVIAGVPGEMTTMAGRRLREALKKQYDQARPVSRPVESVVISGYANAYSQYITTPEEYAMQHYEGASTLFGPHTLDAYIQEFCRLVPAH